MSFVGITYLHLAGATALTAASAEYPITQHKFWPLIAGLLAFLLVFLLMRLSPGPLKYIVFGVFVVLLGQMISVTARRLGQKGLLDDVILTVLGIFLAMSVAGFLAGNRILGFGTYLFAALLGLVIARIVLLVLGIMTTTPTEKVQTILSWFGTILFSIFVAYDTAVLQARGRLREKNPDYVDASLGLFLDIVNLFGDVGDIMNS